LIYRTDCMPGLKSQAFFAWEEERERVETVNTYLQRIICKSSCGIIYMAALDAVFARMEGVPPPLSIGLARFPQDGDNVDKLLSRMYTGKGKKQYG